MGKAVKDMKNFSNYTDYSTKEELHFESKAVHGALGTEPLTGAVSMPIFQAATFRHPELGCSTGFAYSRLENPTRQELERTMAILEGGIKGFAFSSGQAANMAVFSLLDPGDHVVLSDDIYGGTFLTGYERGDIVISTGNSDATVAQVFGGNFIHAENGNRIFRNNNKGTRKCVMRVTGGNFIGAKMIFDDLGDDNRDIYHADATKRTTLNATAPLETLGAFVLLEQNTLGIGFEATLPEATAAALRAIADEGTDLRTGMLICNRDDLESVPYLSRDVLLAKGADYADISCKAKAPEGGDPVYQAAIRGIDRKHLDTQFAAIPYVAVTVNGCEVYYYGLWNEGQAFSMRLIAELALEDVQDAAGAGYENAVASGSQTGKFSPYTTEQRGLLVAYR